MTILIDADGCPVVDLTLQIAKRFVVPVIIPPKHYINLSEFYT